MKKVPKFIWYKGYKYKVVKYYKPTKFDGYLLCIRQEEYLYHGDGKTKPIEMILLNTNRDEFYVSTKKNDKLVEVLVNLQKKHRSETDQIETELLRSWLDFS